MQADDAQPGRRYKVSWEDCCCEGSFESVLKSKNYLPGLPPEPDHLDSVVFENGVTLSGCYGVSFEEVT